MYDTGVMPDGMLAEMTAHSSYSTMGGRNATTDGNVGMSPKQRRGRRHRDQLVNNANKGPRVSRW